MPEIRRHSELAVAEFVPEEALGAVPDGQVVIGHDEPGFLDAGLLQAGLEVFDLPREITGARADEARRQERR